MHEVQDILDRAIIKTQEAVDAVRFLKTTFVSMAFDESPSIIAAALYFDKHY